MSLKVMTWAWTVVLPPAPKLVLMALADEADDRGFCFPSQRHLADKCNIAERSVRRMIRLLAGRGHLAIEQRFRKDRARTSNGYRLAVDHPRTNCPGVPDSAGRGEGSPVSRGPGHSCPGAPDKAVRLTTTEPCFYPKPPQPQQGATRYERWVGGGELCFPKGMTEVQVQALLGQVAGLTNEHAQRVLDELAGRIETTRVRNPIRYCATLVSRYKRGEFTTELGVQIAARRDAERQREARLRNAPGVRQQLGREHPHGLPEHLAAALERIRDKSNAQRD